MCGGFGAATPCVCVKLCVRVVACALCWLCRSTVPRQRPNVEGGVIRHLCQGGGKQAGCVFWGGGENKIECGPHSLQTGVSWHMYATYGVSEVCLVDLQTHDVLLLSLFLWLLGRSRRCKRQGMCWATWMPPSLHRNPSCRHTRCVLLWLGCATGGTDMICFLPGWLSYPPQTLSRMGGGG